MPNILAGPRAKNHLDGTPSTTASNRSSRQSNGERTTRQHTRRSKHAVRQLVRERAPLGTPHHLFQNSTSNTAARMRPFARQPMAWTNSGSGGMYANHARAAELKAARARRAQEDAARIEDEQDQIPEAMPTTLEQFIVTGNRGRTTRSSTPNGGTNNSTRQAIHNLGQNSQADSENDLSDSVADLVPASSQASHSQAPASNQPSERMTHSIMRPSFSRTAQGYDTPSVVHSSPHAGSITADVPQQQHGFNPRAAQFTGSARNVNDDPFTEHGRHGYPVAYGHTNTGQAIAAYQPSIRVTIPNSKRPANNDLQYPCLNDSGHQQMISDHSQQSEAVPPPGVQRDHRPYTSFAAANGRDQLLQQLYSLPGLEAKKRAQDSINVSNYDPVLRGSGIDSRSSVQTSYYQPTPIGMPPANPSPVMASAPSSGFDVDKPFSWKERHGNIFKEPVTAEVEPLQACVISTSKSLASPPSLNIPPTARLRPEVLATGTVEVRSLHDAEDWWYREFKQRQDLHKHLTNVARNDPYNLAPKGPGLTHFKKPASDLSDQELLVAALSQLQTYVTTPDANKPRRFGQFSGRVAEWCIDKGPRGNQSFFDDNWGAPPPRVGRDPRYQTTFHEGRYTVFEEGDRRPTRV